MGRRQQRGLALAVSVVALLFRLASLAAAQEASPSPAPASPTPQPSPPTATPTRKPTPSPKPIAMPKPLPLPAASPDQTEIARREAARKERRQEIESFLDGKGGDAAMAKMLERLPPGEDREAFRRNLIRWRDLPPQERDALRGQADDRGERIRAEIDNAIKESGLHLNADQTEIFALRYRQERRKLERSLLDQMNAERARRLPGIVEQLKKEFPQPAMPTPPSATATPAANPSPGPSPSAVSK